MKIGDYAFEENNAITSVVIPEGVKEIGNYAFEECGKLTSVSLPEGLAIIGFDAFCGCRKLGDITIPATVHPANGSDSFRAISFCFCHGMKSITVADGSEYYKSVDGVLFSMDGTRFLSYPAGKSTATNYILLQTATNRSGKSSTKTVKIVTPNVVDKSAITIDAANRYEVNAGFAFNAAAWEALGINALDGWKITAASGISGLSWKNGRLTGVPTATGAQCATFTMTNGKQKKTATATFFINPLPSGIAWKQ